MQGEPFSRQGVDERRVDNRCYRDDLGIERCDSGLPIMVENLGGGFCGFVKIGASRAARKVGVPFVLGRPCGFDARQNLPFK